MPRLVSLGAFDVCVGRGREAGRGITHIKASELPGFGGGVEGAGANWLELSPSSAASREVWASQPRGRGTGLGAAATASCSLIPRYWQLAPGQQWTPSILHYDRLGETEPLLPRQEQGYTGQSRPLTPL